jgi:hypothetical protein
MNRTHDANKFLEKAYSDIRKEGERIVDDDMRQSYYTNIKEHKEIIGEWEQVKSQK